MERWDWRTARTRCLREAERILPASVEAEDAVQEALLRAWRQQSACRNPDSPMPWLVQIARNEALRLRSRSAGREEGELTHEPADEDQRYAQVDDRVDVAQLLATLSTEDRRLLELRYSEDLTQPSVAARLGVPEGTVKVRLHRLRTRLRLALETQG